MNSVPNGRIPSSVSSFSISLRNAASISTNSPRLQIGPTRIHSTFYVTSHLMHRFARGASAPKD
jgi:hypothetical protein